MTTKDGKDLNHLDVLYTENRVKGKRYTDTGTPHLVKNKSCSADTALVSSHDTSVGQEGQNLHLLMMSSTKPKSKTQNIRAELKCQRTQIIC
jgi:hypothetical protein